MGPNFARWSGFSSFISSLPTTWSYLYSILSRWHKKANHETVTWAFYASQEMNNLEMCYVRVKYIKFDWIARLMKLGFNHLRQFGLSLMTDEWWSYCSLTVREINICGLFTTQPHNTPKRNAVKTKKLDNTGFLFKTIVSYLSKNPTYAFHQHSISTCQLAAWPREGPCNPLV